MKVLLETAHIQFRFSSSALFSRVKANASCHLEWSTSCNCFLVSVSVRRDAFILLRHPLAIEP